VDARHALFPGCRHWALGLGRRRARLPASRRQSPRPAELRPHSRAGLPVARGAIWVRLLRRDPHGFARHGDPDVRARSLRSVRPRTAMLPGPSRGLSAPRQPRVTGLASHVPRRHALALSPRTSLRLPSSRSPVRSLRSPPGGAEGRRLEAATSNVPPLRRSDPFARSACESGLFGGALTPRGRTHGLVLSSNHDPKGH
jgi:hypothetical protein